MTDTTHYRYKIKKIYRERERDRCRQRAAWLTYEIIRALLAEENAHSAAFPTVDFLSQG